MAMKLDFFIHIIISEYKLFLNCIPKRSLMSTHFSITLNNNKKTNVEKNFSRVFFKNWLKSKGLSKDYHQIFLLFWELVLERRNWIPIPFMMELGMEFGLKFWLMGLSRIEKKYLFKFFKWNFTSNRVYTQFFALGLKYFR
jgi:hypothetical protein